MIQKYKTVSIIYGGTGRKYAEALNRRIFDMSESERFPISSKIIMENILTRELLSDVMDLFKESEFCVAFLTADDYCGNEYRRLRQNVVFELGMALIQLGRERCILLSDFDVRTDKIDMPTDMNSLEIRQFQKDDFESVLDSVLNKILQFSKESFNINVMMENVPQYDHLLTREDYYVDYQNTFAELRYIKHKEGKKFLTDLLLAWYEECASLPHFDEQCIFLLERIAFLPIFGTIQEVNEFLFNSSLLVENYKKSDIQYYGNTETLNFSRNTILNIIEYTRIKTERKESDGFKYEMLLSDFLSEEISDKLMVNPLIKLAYYDYLGLTYLKLYQINSEVSHLAEAEAAFKKALEYTDRVDMSLQLWSGYITYNLARTYSALNDSQSAKKYYKRAIKIRERWLRNSNYNITIRNALSYEYFLAKVDYIDMCKHFSLLSNEEVQREYSLIEAELNSYSNIDDKIDQLIVIRELLEKKLKG